MTILNFTPESDPALWAMLQPPNSWTALVTDAANESDAAIDLEAPDLEAETLESESFEQFELNITGLETDWEEID